MSWSRAAVFAGAVGILGAAGPARAQDAFEIQVYDSEVAGPGQPGLELHLNEMFAPSRDAGPGEVSTAHLVHLTLEPHLGIGQRYEIGGYLQTALQPNCAYDYGGMKLRIKAVTTKVWDGRIGFGLNAEVSSLPRRFEPGAWGGELRPIADFRAGILYATLNPILSFAFGEPRPAVPSFEPAAKIALGNRDLSGGLEYYGGWGQVGIGPIASATHRLFAAFDLASAWIDVNVALGYSVGALQGWIANLNLGFHPPSN